MVTIAALVMALSVAPEVPVSPADQDAEGPPTYVPGGRRDPFLSRAAGAKSSEVCPGRGLAAFPVHTLALRGVIRALTGTVAMLMAPDQRSYFGAPGDRLCDGWIVAATLDGVVLAERVEDPLRERRTRSVVLRLHP